MAEDGVEGNGGRPGRKEKRKILKKMKRKEKRKDVALKEKLEEEMKLNDPEEQRRMEASEREERERLETERKKFEERERLWMENMMMKAAAPLQTDPPVQDETHDTDSFEYVEEGPAEIIWQGNEIIVKKKKVKVPKKKARQTVKEEAERATSNPLPPQGEAYTDSLTAPVFSAQQVYDNLAQQVPSFGTEQDKDHCPFHIKTGVCRFGSRCNRAHFYPDKSCTLLIKNMYSGPGLAWEQDEALEYTEEEVKRSFEEFYEDVHTEFLKFGEIINFKVCRNGSAHLRGNVYVHYKMLDSALLAHLSINGRFFAGKQVKCEYVGVTRWKIAICGEYMKTRLSTCSRGTACNFIHCFRNPGGDYEWADWDKPPPKYWVKKMSALFGYTDDSIDKFRARSPSQLSDKNSQRMTSSDANRYHHSRRSRSRDTDSSSHSSRRDRYKKIDHGVDPQRQRYKHEGRISSMDTPERDCVDTMMLRNNSKEISLSRRSSDCQTRDEGFTLSEDEVYADGADQDRSNKESHSETRFRRASSRSRHEVEITKDSKSKRSRICGSEDESNDNGGLGLDQVKGSCKHHCSRTAQQSKIKDKSRCTNWDKGGDEEEVRLSHKYQEENNDKRRDRERISLKRMGHDRAIINHRDGKENVHDHRKKRRRSSELTRENCMYSHDYANKKKTYSADLNDIHSDDDGRLRSSSPIYLESEAVGFIDRWDPS